MEPVIMANKKHKNADKPFKWKHAEGEMILWLVTWYCRHALSYRDLKEIAPWRGLEIDRSTLCRWVQEYSPEINKRIQPYLKRICDSHKIDETYIKTKGKWHYLYRAIDKQGNTLDWMLSKCRNKKAAKRFFKKILANSHVVTTIEGEGRLGSERSWKSTREAQGFLEQSTGYGSKQITNATRARFLQGVPKENIRSIFVPSLTRTSGSREVEEGAWVTIVQKKDKNVPVFLLPATTDETNEMNKEQRRQRMEKEFDAAYCVYADQTEHPTAKRACVATAVAGTRTPLGGNHFTSMIKPPGREFKHLDPTTLGGVQSVNRTQCGGYSAMIEGDAIIHYAQKTKQKARQDSEKSGLITDTKRMWTRFKLRTSSYFAGIKSRAVTADSSGEPVKRAKYKTDYAEMADATALKLADAFDNSTYRSTRTNVARQNSSFRP